MSRGSPGSNRGVRRHYTRGPLGSGYTCAVQRNCTHVACTPVSMPSSCSIVRRGVAKAAAATGGATSVLLLTAAAVVQSLRSGNPACGTYAGTRPGRLTENETRGDLFLPRETPCCRYGANMTISPLCGCTTWGCLNGRSTWREFAACASVNHASGFLGS